VPRFPATSRAPHDAAAADGIPNLLEFPLAGEDPTVPNPTVGSITGLTLSFTKRPGTTGLSYTIQESTDLGILDAWAEVTGGTYINNATTTAISYTLPSTNPKHFLRLRVSQQ
jgi:hypothetical protein